MSDSPTDTRPRCGGTPGHPGVMPKGGDAGSTRWMCLGCANCAPRTISTPRLNHSASCESQDCPGCAPAGDSPARPAVEEAWNEYDATVCAIPVDRNPLNARAARAEVETAFHAESAAALQEARDAQHRAETWWWHEESLRRAAETTIAGLREQVADLEQEVVRQQRAAGRARADRDEAREQVEGLRAALDRYENPKCDECGLPLTMSGYDGAMEHPDGHIGCPDPPAATRPVTASPSSVVTAASATGGFPPRAGSGFESRDDAPAAPGDGAPPPRGEA